LLFPESYSGSRLELEALLSTDFIFLLLSQVAMLIGTFGSIFIMTSYVEKESLSFLKSMFKFNGMIFGIAFGIISIAVCLIILAIIDPIKIIYKGLSPSLLFYLIIFFIVAVNEETLTRGFIFHSLFIKTNKNIAIIISSLIFASLHIFNSSNSILSIINLILSGILFALLYLKEMNLAIPIGFHFCWNFLQGPILGFAVSGFQTQSIFKVVNKSGVNFSFLGFGLEGSLILTVVTILSIGYFIYNSYRNRIAKGTAHRKQLWQEI
jgi:hypothetical protein